MILLKYIDSSLHVPHPTPSAWLIPAKRAFTLLCLDQSQRTAPSLFLTLCMDSDAMPSKCSAHSRQPKKYCTYPLIVGRTSDDAEKTEQEKARGREKTVKMNVKSCAENISTASLVECHLITSGYISKEQLFFAESLNAGVQYYA